MMATTIKPFNRLKGLREYLLPLIKNETFRLIERSLLLDLLFSFGDIREYKESRAEINPHGYFL